MARINNKKTLEYFTKQANTTNKMVFKTTILSDSSEIIRVFYGEICLGQGRDKREASHSARELLDNMSRELSLSGRWR